MKEELVDLVFKNFKNVEWFRNMSLDQQGEFCVMMADNLKKLAAVASQAAVKDFFRKYWCGNVDKHNENIRLYGTCKDCKILKKDP